MLRTSFLICLCPAKTPQTEQEMSPHSFSFVHRVISNITITISSRQSSIPHRAAVLLERDYGWLCEGCVRSSVCGFWRAGEGRKTLSATAHLADLERPTHLPILLSPLRMGQTTVACVFSETSLHMVPQSKSSSLSSKLILSFHSHGIISIKLFYLLTVWSLSSADWYDKSSIHWPTQKSRVQGSQ